MTDAEAAEMTKAGTGRRRQRRSSGRQEAGGGKRSQAESGKREAGEGMREVVIGALVLRNVLGRTGQTISRAASRSFAL